MNDRYIALMVNPKAGKGKSVKISAKIIRKLSASETLFTLFEAEWPEQLISFSDIFLVGGDGTLNYFINKYPGVSMPITLFKGGSGNDFAWKLYGNSTFDQLFETAMRGQIFSVDAGICNGRHFINGMGIGFDGKVVKLMGDRKIISAGHLTYLLTVFQQIFFFREVAVAINKVTGSGAISAFMISVANGSHYGGGFLVAPEAKVNDGKFDVVIINKLSVMKRLRYLPMAISGRHMSLPFVESFRCSTIEITSDTLIPAHLDGELIEAKYFHIAVLPSRFHFRTLSGSGF